MRRGRGSVWRWRRRAAPKVVATWAPRVRMAIAAEHNLGVGGGPRLERLPLSLVLCRPLPVGPAAPVGRRGGDAAVRTAPRDRRRRGGVSGTLGVECHRGRVRRGRAPLPPARAG